MKKRSFLLQHIAARFAVAVLTLLPGPARAERAISCHDGDTCRFSKNGQGQGYKVRFAGFDAPEIDQMLGSTSRNKMWSLLEGKDATLKCNGRSYDRQVCEVFVDGKDVGFEMVSSGLAFDYPKFSHGKFRNAQNQARSAHLGVWGVKGMTSPMCKRHGKKRWASPRCAADPMYMP